ncbi:MAG: response regulator [Dehalococcoidales bacterium]|nr:MAG: response regulator [Dehalococcoidales bacterium]
MDKKILVVEDNPLNMKLIEMTLKPRGYVLLKASDGQEAFITAVTEHPDLIIMDIQLPGVNGLDVTRKLRETPSVSDTPIIGVTAYAMKGDREKIIEAGCDAYLSKPVDTRQLPELIAKMLLTKYKANPSS